MSDNPEPTESDPPPDPPKVSRDPEPSLGSAKKATSWVLVGFGGAQVLRLTSNVLLARLLEPKMFALMAIVNTVLQGLNMFSDTGIGPNIIQSKRGSDPVFLNTAWSVQILRGTGLWIATALLAWPVSKIYGQPLIAPVLATVGSAAFFSGLMSTSVLVLQKQMKLGIATVMDLSTQLLQIIVMVVWAYLSPSVWALAAGSITSSLVRTTWSHFLNVGPKNRPRWDRDAVKELRSFGQWIFVGTALSFLALQSDKLLLGKMLDPSVFGVYSIAVALAAMPVRITGRLARRIIFPKISALTDQSLEQVRKQLSGQRRRLLLLTGALAVGGFVLGDIPIRVLYTSEYQAASWMFPILALGVWMTGLSVSLDFVPLAFGKSSYTAAGTGARFAFIAVALPLGVLIAGALGAVVVMALAGLPAYVVMLFALRRLGLRVISQDLRYSAAFVAACVLGIALRLQLGFDHPVFTIFFGN